MTEEEFSGSPGISVTVKGSEGFDAPWIVIHARSVAEAREMMLELNASDLMQGTAAVAAKFQSHFQQKPRYNNNRGGSGSRGGSGAQSAPPSTATSTAPAASVAAPPPAFVPQNAQPADWGDSGQAVQQLQQNLGATVVSQVPNEVAYCADHGNAPRQYNEPGANRNTGKQFSASYRCAIDGCPAWWQQNDGTWQRAKRR